MPFNLLLLPFLGGYFFIHFFYLTRFRAYQLSSYRLLIETAGAGFVFLVLSHSLVTLALSEVVVTLVREETNLVPWVRMLRRFAPFPYSASAGGAFLLAVASSLALNRICGKEWAMKYVIENYGDDLMRLLRRAFSDTRAIMLTLSSGKVYVGLVPQDLGLNPNLSYVSILPTLSGFRRQDTHKVVFTVNYSDAYEAIEGGQITGIDASSMEIIIPHETITSARLFDQELYEDTFNAPSFDGNDKALK